MAMIDSVSISSRVRADWPPGRAALYGGRWEDYRFDVRPLDDRASELDRESAVVIYCGTGYRAIVAASRLRHPGFPRAGADPGSCKSWTAAELPVTDPRARRWTGRRERRVKQVLQMVSFGP